MADEPENFEDYELVNAYVDALLRGGKRENAQSSRLPSAELRMAALLNSISAPESVPSQEFVERLSHRFGVSPASAPTPEATAAGSAMASRRRSKVARWRFSRRGFLEALGATVALLLGGLSDRLAPRLSAPSPGPGWVPVARAAELAPGTVKRFAQENVVGHVLNIGGKLWALSAVCTHQACLLDWQPASQLFDCSCHGAAFNADGTQHTVPSYDHVLPPLPRLPVKVMNGQVFVRLDQQQMQTAPNPY